MNTDKIYAKMLAAEYAPTRSRKLIALRKLDKKARRPARVFAYLFGISAALMFSAGICLLAMHLTCPSVTPVYWGGIFFAIGLFAMSINFPLFEKILNRVKQRYAFEIVELAKEVCEQAFT